MVYRYEIRQPLTLPGLASERRADLWLDELDSARGCRVVGGDRGDLEFRGYWRREEQNVTEVCDPVLVTAFDDLSEQEAYDIATEILEQSFASIGLETLE